MKLLSSTRPNCKRTLSSNDEYIQREKLIGRNMLFTVAFFNQLEVFNGGFLDSTMEIQHKCLHILIMSIQVRTSYIQYERSLTFIPFWRFIDKHPEPFSFSGLEVWHHAFLFLIILIVKSPKLKSYGLWSNSSNSSIRLNLRNQNLHLSWSFTSE